MGLQLHDQKEPDDTISFREMTRGQVAVIVQWGHRPRDTGTVVHLAEYGNDVYLIALTCDDVWHEAFDNTDHFPDHTHRVRLLPKGTLLEVQ